MKRELKYFVQYGILFAAIFLCGCGNGSSAVNSQNGKEIKEEETAYIVETASMPEYASFDCAYSDGTDLYYAAADLDQDSQQFKTAFYTMKQGVTEPELNFYLEEGQRVLKMTMDAEGNIYYIGYRSIPEEGGSGQMISDYMLYKLDRQGVPLLELDLKEITGGQEQNIPQGLAVDDQNRIVLYASDQNIFVLDPTGSRLFETHADGMISAVCSSGGKVFVSYRGMEGEETREIDIPGKKLSAKWEHNIPGDRYYMAAGGDGNLLIATESSVYRCDPETKETVKKFDWQTYDFIGMVAGILLPYGESGVLVINRDYGTFPMKTEATVFREADEGEAVANPSSEKTVLTLGALYPLQLGLNTEIINFNKSNPDYKIEIKNYNEDYTRLNADIMAGNGPDILVLPSYRMEQLAARGVLEDLNPYLDGDETLDRDDFVENVLKAFETRENLYGIPLSFNFRTIVGKTSVLGDKSGWNLDELIAFAESVPEGTDIFDDASKSGVLSLVKYAYINQLVDIENISNPLDRELLMKMLKFADQFENDDQYTYDIELAGKIGEGRVLLLDTLISYGHGYFGCSGVLGEPVTFIGYPSEGKNGNLIQSYSILSVNSGSKHKDIAWKLIGTLLSEEAQMRMEADYTTTGFHIRKDVLEYHLSWAMENAGNYALFTTNGSNYVEYKFTTKMKEEDLRPIRNLIQNADTVRMVSPDIDQIIEEEALFYFNGTKPIEEVVDVIENRVRTYVNEIK